MNYAVTDPKMQHKVERWLRDGNNCYTFEDIMQGIKDGHFQTHLFGDTWVLTSIHDWPQRRSVHIDLVVGSMEESLEIEPQICEWARSVGADLITGGGRPGWDPIKSNFSGSWRLTGYTYAKDL